MKLIFFIFKRDEEIKTLQELVDKEINSLEDSLLNHRQSLKLFLEESGKEAKIKGDELTKIAVSNIGIINNNLKKGLSNIEEGVDLQLQKIDTAIAKHHQEINSYNHIDYLAETILRLECALVSKAERVVKLSIAWQLDDFWTISEIACADKVCHV